MPVRQDDLNTILAYLVVTMRLLGYTATESLEVRGRVQQLWDTAEIPLVERGVRIVEEEARRELEKNVILAGMAVANG